MGPTKPGVLKAGAKACEPVGGSNENRIQNEASLNGTSFLFVYQWTILTSSPTALGFVLSPALYAERRMRATKVFREDLRR